MPNDVPPLGKPEEEARRLGAYSYKAACESCAECMQWSYDDGLCRMDDKPQLMGSGFTPGLFQKKTRLIITSG
ncbi:uncharacterized protein FPRO_11380 [Fusarium proliferatum ET1]|uniref:Uncharacterized protein n=1 Tax=Fusarium proliferatum (strain ET1) TaxID=1227346 RepID=A0A1L7VZU6_FUSPR|nr:uncharacterized protein FPRO_11380 [Fusarium proliferatum ET1]CZR45933.1 uncharacterized protein FPRO_11380 [Fusarium proliferatum ET1]